MTLATMEYTVSSGATEEAILKDIKPLHTKLSAVKRVTHGSHDIQVRMQFTARLALQHQDTLQPGHALIVLCRHEPRPGGKTKRSFFESDNAEDQQDNVDATYGIAYCLLNMPSEFQTPQPAPLVQRQ